MQKDYDLNEKIIPAKVDSFEWIQTALDYKYDKAIRSIESCNVGQLLCIHYHDAGVGVSTQAWLVVLLLPNDKLGFCISLVMTDSYDFDDNQNIIQGTNNLKDFYNIISGSFIDVYDPAMDVLENFAYIMQFLAENYHEYRIFGYKQAVGSCTYYSKMDVLNYLRDTFYDIEDVNLKPLPYYYSMNKGLSVDEYGQKMEIDKGDVGWWQGQFPLTPNFHMVFWDGNSYFLPDGTQMAELTQRYSENSLDFGNQYLIVRPTSRILSRYLYFILPRRGISAYGRAGDWEEPDLKEVIQIRKSFQKMEFQVNLWQFGTPRFIILQILKYMQIQDPGDVINKPYLLYISSPDDWYMIVNKFNSLNQLDVISSLLTKIGGVL